MRTDNPLIYDKCEINGDIAVTGGILCDPLKTALDGYAIIKEAIMDQDTILDFDYSTFKTIHWSLDAYHTSAGPNTFNGAVVFTKGVEFSWTSTYTSSATLSSYPKFVLVNPTSDTILTLPDATTMPGEFLAIYNIATSNGYYVKIKPNATQKLNGYNDSNLFSIYYGHKKSFFRRI